MEEHPNVGYVFCPGLILEDGCEKGLVDWAVLDKPDSILNGCEFLYRLLTSNCILAPAVLARTECYRTIGPFPLDMPYAGDWYLWCAFALHHDVAYFAEPMVNYRLHNSSMTNTLRGQDISILSRDLLALCWRIREKINATGHPSLQRHCEREFYRRYFEHIMDNSINLEELELYLHNFTEHARQRETIEKKAVERAVFKLYLKKEFQRARGMNSRLTANDGPVQSYGLITLFLDSVILGFLLLGPLGGVIEPALQAAEIARSANRPTLNSQTTFGIDPRIASPGNVPETSSVASPSMLPLPHRSCGRAAAPLPFPKSRLTDVGPVELWATR
jgi:hypothetical protein